MKPRKFLYRELTYMQRRCDLIKLTKKGLELQREGQPTITRQRRVESNKQKIFSFLNENQRDFIQFILANYVSKGYEELDDSKLKYTIDSKYGDVNDAEQKLGSVDEIRKTFLEFQKYLYEKNVA